MLYTEGLHKIERPKFERRAASDFSALMLLPPGDAIGMMTPDEASVSRPTTEPTFQHWPAGLRPAEQF
jgi:hypothetical protein